jgi:hypothetical protein
MFRRTMLPAIFVLLLLITSARDSRKLQRPNTCPAACWRSLLMKTQDATNGLVFAAVGANVHHKIDSLGVSVLEVPEQALDAVTQALQRSGRFTFVERDFVAHGMATPMIPISRRNGTQQDSGAQRVGHHYRLGQCADCLSLTRGRWDDPRSFAKAAARLELCNGNGGHRRQWRFGRAWDGCVGRCRRSHQQLDWCGGSWLGE